MAFTVTEIELNHPLPSTRSGDHTHVLALAKWRGAPLGWAWAEASGGEVAPAQWARSVREQLGWELVTTVFAHPNGPVELPPISVVVCTRNRSGLLEGCLASLDALRYPAYEVIVVDNAPEDDLTRQTVERHNARYAREDRPGLDNARNRGITEARYDIIAFTDDDARADASWLEGMARGFADPGIMAVTGLVAPLELDTGAQVLFEHVYGGMGKGMQGRLHYRETMRWTDMIAIHQVGVGANMAFRREVFSRIGAFDPALDVGTPSGGAGDLDMFHRTIIAGLPLWYEPRALVWHRHRPGMDQLRRQLFNDGRSFTVYLINLWKRREVSRLALARYSTWVWARWLVGRVVLGLARRHRLPLGLLWAGLHGALTGPAAYRATYRRKDAHA